MSYNNRINFEKVKMNEEDTSLITRLYNRLNVRTLFLNIPLKIRLFRIAYHYSFKE